MSTLKRRTTRISSETSPSSSNHRRLTRLRRLNLERLEERAMLAVRVWDGGAGNANWSSAANWAGDVSPMAGDDLIFAAGAAQANATNDLPAGTQFNTIEIGGTGYNITGNAITLAGGLTANNVSGSNTFALNITLQNAQTLMNANPAATLNLTGAINTGNLVGNYFFGTAPAIVFDGSGVTNATGVISGAGSISKLGAGTVVLGGANTYEGLTEARQGFIRVTNASGLGSSTTGYTEVQAGAAVELAGASTTENFVIREGGVGFGNGADISSAGALRAVGGTVSRVNNVELIGGNNLIGAAAGSTIVVDGVVTSGISNTNRLIKVGPGTLQLAGSNPNVFRGETRVLGGTLELNKSTGVNAIGGDLIIGDNLGGDNAAVVRLLQDNQIPHLNFFDAGLNTVTLNSSGLLDLNGRSDTLGNLVLTTGAAYSADITIGAGTLTLGGASVTLNGFQGSSGASPPATISGGTFSLGTQFSGAGGGTTKTFNIGDSQLANTAGDLSITSSIAGAADVGIVKTGVGTLRLGGNSTFAGPFLMTSGFLEIGSNTALGTGLVSLQNSQNNNNVVRTFGASRTIANAISIDGDVYFLGDDATPGADNLTFTGNVTLTAGRTLFTEDPTQTITFAGPIGEGAFGSSVLNKSGRGTIAFEAANTYSGSTTLNNDGGTLILRGAGSILNVNALTVGIGATLQIDNSAGNLADRINDATGVTLNGRLMFVGNSTTNSSELVGTISPGTDVSTTIEVQNTSGGAFSSVLVGNSLTLGNNRPTRFVGTGLPLTATGQNRFALTNNPGALLNGIIQQGVIEGPGGALDFATYDSGPEGIAIIPLPAAAYVTDLALATTTSNVKLTSSVGLSTSKNVNALLLGPNVNLSGVNATLTVSAGNVIQANGSNISVSNVNFGGGGLVYTPGGATATIDGSIYNAGALRKNGAGKLILSGDNQYTGQTQVNDGVLNIRRSTALGAAAGDTLIRPTGSLELEQTSFGAINIGLENINVNGTGGLANVGGLRNLAGNNSLAGILTIDGNLGATNDIPLKYGGWMGINSVINSFGYVDVAVGTTFTSTGNWTGTQDLVKIGGGTLEFAGIGTSPNRSTRVYQGTLLLNREPGIGLAGGFGTAIIGSDALGAPAATVRLGQTDQLRDDNNIYALSTGTLDLNGQSDRIAGALISVGPAGAGKINIGNATLILNGDINVFGLGTGNATGSTITGGTLALNVFGDIGAAFQRTFLVNEGAAGTDLTITSAIVDGSGLRSAGISKTGFGALELGGATANTYTNTTTVNEGTLLLNKGTGAGGVSAFLGNLTIGNNDVTSGFAGSDLVRSLQPNQIPDSLINVTLASTGRWELNGNNETIGLADAQNVLTMQGGSTIDLGAGTLRLLGNINTNAAQGAGLWTPVVGTSILNGTLDLGSITRTIDVPDRSELPYEMEISSRLVGTGGYLFTNGGTLLLSGDNSGLSGDIVRTNGNFAVGSDTAFGTGRVLMNDGAHIATYGGARTLGNVFFFSNNTRFLGGNNMAGSGALGGGGNDLKFTGAVNIAAGNWFPTVAIAGQVEFAGGIGETFGGAFVRKQGFGTMVISSAATFSNGLEIGQDAGGGPAFTRLNGGTVVFRDGGTLYNSTVLIGIGGVLQVDNSGLVNPNRFSDGVNIDIAGGTLALVGKSGAAVSETFGTLRLRNNSSASAVQSILPTAAGSSATWRFASMTLEAANVGNTIKFIGRGTNLTSSGPNRLGFITIPTLANTIIPYAVMQSAGGIDFVTVVNPTPSATPGDNFVSVLNSGPYFSTTFVGATATTNVKLAASEAINGTQTVSAVLLPTSGLTVSGGGTLTVAAGLLASSGNNTVSVSTLNLGGAEGILFSDSGTLTASANIAGGATSDLATAGSGTVILAGNNSYIGTTRVTSGVTRVTSNTAFGTTAGNVTVTYGSTVELSGGVNIAAETIDVSGTGDANLGSVGLRSVSGVNTWNGNLTLQISGINRNAIEVASGSTLVLAGVVSGQGLSKTGPGILELAGGSANTFGGGGLLIWQGTVNLNKSGVNAVATNTTVGDNVGAANAESLVLLQSNQIADGNNVTVSSVGRFDYNTSSDTINVFSLQGGLTASGTITGASGVLTINGNSSIDGIANSGGGGSFGPTTIAGNLALQIAGAAAATRTITVNDTTAVDDVVVTAIVTDGDGNANLQSLTKAGSGRMVLRAANTFTGQVTVSGGELVVADALALGTPGTLASGSGTLVNTANNNAGANASLLLLGVSVVGEGLRLDSINNNGNNGTGFNGEGALRNLTGASSWSGDVTINTDNSNNFANVTIKVDTDTQLTLSGAIGQQNQSTVGLGVTKIGEGTLTYSGTTANTYTGPTLVGQGVLQLNKTAGTNAIAGTLTIGNINGGQGTDIVRWLQANQLATGQTILVESGGLLDLNGNSETLDGFSAATNALNLRLNTSQSGQVATGAAGSLVLTANANIASTLNGGSFQTFLSPGSSISGNLNLSGVTHAIDVGDVGLLHGEMLISAAITGALASNAFTKTGAGVLALSADNSVGLAGAVTTLSAGGFALLHSNALGTATSTLNITGGTTLFGNGTPNVGNPVAPLSYPMPITLNSDLTLRGSQSFTIGGTITNFGGNRTLTSNLQAAATATLAGAINLSNDATSRTLTINNNTFGGGVNNTIFGGDVTISGQIVNGGGSAASVFTKGGNGLLTLTNDTNSFGGVATVAGGILRVTASGALGANGSLSTNQTTVNSGATLLVAAGLTLPEWLVLNNNGFGNFGSIRLADATPNVTQTTTISGNVNFNATAFVGVDAGGANPDRMIFSGALVSGGGLTTKVGLGEVEFAGTTDNGVAFTGGPSPFDDGIEVRAGTLYLNKTGTNRVITGGAINVGDGGGGDNADRLILIGSGTDQIGDGLTVTVGSTGKLTMAGAATTETIAALVLTTGESNSGDSDTAAGILTVTGNVTVNTFAATDGAAPASQLAGTMIVNGTFAVNDTFAPSASDDLIVTANFYGAPPVASGGFFAGLREGRIFNNAFDTTTPNPGNVAYLYPRLGETSASPPWGDTQTWVYTGEVFDADGIFSFAENIDDNVLILIDGIERLRNTAFNVPTSTANTANNLAPAANVTNSFGMGPNNDGWHSIEIRIGNGTGGAGAFAGTGWTASFGLGFSSSGSTGVNGSNDGYVIPLDPGNQTLFRTPAVGIIPVAATGLVAPAFNKSGLGTLNLKSSIPQTFSTVSGGTLTISGAGALPALNNLTVTSGASVLVDNSAGVVANRIGDNALLTLTGGTFSILGNATAATNEVIGPIVLNAASALTNTIQSTTTGGTVTLTSPTLTRNGGATLNLVGVGSDIGSAGNQLQINGGTNPFVNNVVPYAVISGPAGFDLVTDGDGNTGAAPYSLSRVTTYSNNINTASGIVKLDGSEPAANRVLTGNITVAALLLANGVTVSGPGTLTVGTGTAGLVVSRTGGNIISAPVAFGGLEQLILVQAGSLEVSGSITGTNTLRKERPGTLILSADNSGMTGAIQVQQGTIVARNSNAFGTTAGGVNVLAGATLVLDADMTIGAEQLDLAGSTALASGLIVDTLQVTSGRTVTWGTGASVINYNGNGGSNNLFVNVGAGGVLNFNATIGGGNNLFKLGAGELVYQGTVNNVATTTNVNEGTLTLAKSGGAILAVNGTLNINDLGNFDSVGSSLVRYSAGSTSTNLIGDVTVNVNQNGTFDFNGVSDTIANTLNVNGGNISNTAGGGVLQVNTLNMTGGRVDSGTGTFNLNGNLTYTSGLATNGPATINGKLDLVGGTRTITVNDGYFVANDLTINAAISNGRVVKNGNGSLLLTNTGSTLLAGVDEVQSITFTGTPTADTTTFNISFNGNTTATITYLADQNATAAAIQAALQALPNIGVGGVSVTAVSNLIFNITFTGILGSADLLNQITFAYVAANGATGPTLASTNGIAGFRLNAGTLAFNDNNVLGASRLHIDGNVQLLPVGGAKTLPNNLTINPNITVTFGGRRDFGGTDNLTLSGGVTLIGPTGFQTVTLNVNDPQSLVTIAGVISSGGNQLAPLKAGIGTMVWSGNNTFDVRDAVAGSNGGTGQTDGIRIDNGILRVTHSNALGSSGPTANVHVRGDVGATLVIDGTAGSVQLPASRTIVLFTPDNGTSYGFLQRSITSTGVLQSIGGNNSIAGTIDLRNFADNDNAGTDFIRVDADTLVLTGAIFGTRNNGVSDVRNNRNLLKVGAGTLELAGTTINSITGNTAVLEGTLVLNKASGVPAFSGALVVGDNVGAANSDILVLAATEQIPDASTVTVTGSGRMQTSAAQATSLTNEVQQLQVGNAGPSGQFRLQFNGVSTADLAFGATLASIQTALNGLSTIGGVGGNVLVQGAGSGQNQTFTVTFLGSLAGANQPQIKVVAGTTAFAGATIAVTTLAQGGLAGRETVGAITLRMGPQGTGNISLQPGSTLALSGDVTIDNYGGVTNAATSSAVIAGGNLELQRQSAAGAAVSRNFNVVDGPASDDLLVTSTISDGAGASMSNLVKNTGAGSRMVLSGTSTHTGTTVANIGALQIKNAQGLGSAAPNEIQNYVVNSVLGAAAGQYTLTFGSATTAGLSANASAEEVAAALNALTGIGDVGGNVRVVSIINGNTGVQYFIEFGGTLAATDVAQIATNTNTLTGATIGAGATTQGGGLANIGASQTTVNGGGALELDGAGITTSEQLTLNGTGIVNAITTAVFNNGAQTGIGTGALRNLSGNNVWQGNVVINNNPTSIAIDAGSLTLSGASVLSGGGSLLKTGAGVLELGGTLANTYTGNTYVNQGTLRLNKQGVLAIPGGEVMIGDNVGADNSDVLQYAATAGADQIADRVVRVGRTGLFDLNGISDTINNGIVLDVGPTTSGDITTGVGVLTTNNQFTVVNQAGTTAASLPATFRGIYDMNGATRNIDVREGNAPTEFDIQGVIQVAGNFGFNKIGQGRLRLSGANTYIGTTAVNNGVLEVGTPDALGTTAGATTVANLAALETNSATPLTIAENITIAGDGWNNSGIGSLNNIGAGGATLTGTLTITGNSQYVAGASGFGTTTIGNQAPGAASALNLPTAFTWTNGNLVFNGAGDINVPANLSSPLISSPYFSNFEGRLFLATVLGVNNTTGGPNGNGINSLIPGGATIPYASRSIFGPLNFPQDADGPFTTFFGGQPGGTAFTAVYYGTLVIPVDGTYYFAVSNNDDTAAVWLSSGTTFVAGDLLQSVGCCNATGFVSKTLTAGTYNLAFSVEDTGGGSGLTGRFQAGGVAPASSTVMPIISIGEPTLIKNGTGTVTLTGVNGYDKTIVNQGTLIANNATSAVGTGVSTVNGGNLFINGKALGDVVTVAPGLLGGTGTIAGNVSGNGIIAPGVNNVGTLTINGNLTTNGTLRFDVNSPYNTAGVDYDQIIVNGSNNLAGATLTFAGGSVASFPAQPIKLISKVAAGATVAGASPVEGAQVPIGNANFRLSYNGGDGNDVVLDRPLVVYVDDSWTGLAPNTPIVDGDLGTAALEPAMIGGNAFATFAAALNAITASGLIIVNDGTYGETVVLVGTQTIQLTRLNPTTNGVVTINSLDAPVGTTVNLQSNTLRLGDNVGNNTIAGTLSGTGGLTKLGTDTLTLVGAGITFRGDLNVNAGRVTLQDTTAFANGTFATAQALNTLAGATLEFNVAGTQLLGVSGGGVTIGGAGTLLKTGAGVLALDEQGNNSFVINIAMTGGVIDVQQGTLRNGGWQGQNWTNNRASLNLGAAGTFDIWDGSNVVIDALTGSGNFNRSVGGGNGQVTIGANNGTGNFSGTITSPGGPITVVKTGTGTQTFSGAAANTYTGLTTVSAGTLSLAKTAGVNAIAGDVLVTGGILSIAAANQIADTASITVNTGAMTTNSNAETVTNVTINSATLSLLSNLTVTNLLTVTAGTHDISSNTSLTANTVTLSGGSNLRMGANSNPTTINVGAGGLTMNGATIQFGNPGAAGFAATLNLAGNFTGTGTNLFDLQTAPASLNLGATTRTFNVTAGTTTIEVPTVGAGGLTKNGAGTLVLSGTNTYLGTTTVAAGLLTLAGGNAIADAGAVILSNVAGAALNLTASETIGSLSGGGPLGGNVTLGASTLTVGDATSTVYSGNISGTGGLTKVGSGTLELASANSYSGVTSISAGVLRVSNAGALGTTAGNTNIVGNVGGTGVLELVGGIDLAEPIQLEARQGASALVDHIRSVSGNNTLSGTITGATGGSEYNINVVSGSLAITNTVSNTNAPTRNLNLRGAATGNISGSITGNWTLNTFDAGIWTLTASNTYTGGTNVNAGRLVVNNTTGSGTGSGPVSVASGATLGGTGSAAGAVSVSGTLAPGNAGLPGIFTIGGNLTFNATGIFEAQINGIAAGTQHDQIIVSGNVVIASGAATNFSTAVTVAPPQTLTLIQNNSATSIVGNFTGLLEGQALSVNGQKYYVTYKSPLPAGNDFALVRNNVVIANDDPFGAILSGVSFSGNVATNDVDVDNDGTFSIVTPPAHGTVVLDPATGEFIYTPSTNYLGVDTFVYRLSDGEFSDTATASFTISRFAVIDGALYVAGTNAADRIVISNGVLVRINNVAYGPFSAEKVVVFGNGGDDTMSVASSVNIAVEFYGDAGNDYLAGGGANDTLDGGEGNDRLLGGAGNDLLLGGGGTDTLAGGNGTDTLFGDQYLTRDGQQLASLKPLKDTLNGDGGNDTLYGDGGADLLYGGLGNDFLDGGADSDTLDGGDGNDFLFGNLGGDKLYGRGGLDVLVGGSGIDSLLGGASADLLYGGNLDIEDYQELMDMAAMWFAGNQQGAVNAFSSSAANPSNGYTSGDDRLSDTLNGEGDADWFIIFKLDAISTTEKFPANNKLLLP